MPKEQQTFVSLMQAERERLTREREQVFNQQQALEERLREINNELRAFDVFEQAKQGKLPERQSSRSDSDRKTRGGKGGGGRKGGKREEVLRLVRDGGGTRAELIQKLGVKGDKQGEQSLSNALSALKREGKISQGQGGRYDAAA